MLTFPALALQQFNSRKGVVGWSWRFAYDNAGPTATELTQPTKVNKIVLGVGLMAYRVVGGSVVAGVPGLA
jgi:hypothetical protein